jgi:hypothetical protein
VPPLLQKVTTPSIAQFGSYPGMEGMDEVAVAVPQPALLQIVVESALLYTRQEHIVKSCVKISTIIVAFRFGKEAFELFFNAVNQIPNAIEIQPIIPNNFKF